MSPEPPLTHLTELDAQLGRSGFAVLEPGSLMRLCGIDRSTAEAWQALWDDLPPDGYLRDGGRYRRRRHGCFEVRPGPGEPSQRVEAMPHRAHWQPVEYNALHGGIQRWFEPLHDGLVRHPGWARLLVSLADVADRLVSRPRAAVELAGEPAGAPSPAAASPAGAGQPQTSSATWSIEAHPFRIDTADGIGRPTPEGAHRDGVDLVVVILVSRVAVKGGETRVFDARGPQGLRFTLAQPWSALLLDDERVIHETTPIQPASTGTIGHRDTLVLTFRRGGFQGPPGE